MDGPGAARGVRARRRAAQVRRAEPGRRPRRRARTSRAYMERLGLPVEFVGGLRVSDADTVEVAKMVLVGKVNKDIVLRLNRHGQPAVGPLRRRRAAVPRRAPAGAERRGHRLRRAHRARRRRRAQPHRRRTTSRSSRRSAPTARATPTTSTPTRRPAPWPRALRRLQGDVPHRRRGLAARPRRPRHRVISEASADEVEAALGGVARRDAPQAAGVRATRSTAAWRSRTSSTAACRTRCCSSCSPTPASARRSARRRHDASPTSRRSSATHLVPAYARMPVEFVRGEGARLWDAEGNEYLDFLSGLWRSTASATATRPSSPRSASRPRA